MEKLPQPSARHRRIMNVINFAGFVCVISLMMWFNPGRDVVREAREASPDPVPHEAEANYCDRLPEYDEQELDMITDASLYARYVTERYIVLIAVDREECPEGEGMCLHCTSFAQSDEGSFEVADRFQSACNVFMELSREAEVMEPFEQNRLLEGYVHVGAAFIISEVSSERICNLRYAFDAERLFPSPPPRVPLTAPVPSDDPISI